MTLKRLAVLVDGDNISPKFAPQIQSAARTHGRCEMSRVYLDASTQSGWLVEPGWRVMHAGSGKNGADILLSIEAMQLALADGVENFLIASSDGDFSHLAVALRERGKWVSGIGEEKAPEGFRSACHGFTLLRNDSNLPCCATGMSQSSTASALDTRIKSVIQKHSRQGKGMRISDLNPRMRNLHGTKISSMPEKNWRSYLTARPHLYDLDPRGPEAMVRFLPDGFR